jgi:hypothetical protein
MTTRILRDGSASDRSWLASGEFWIRFAAAKTMLLRRRIEGVFADTPTLRCGRRLRIGKFRAEFRFRIFIEIEGEILSLIVSFSIMSCA